MTRQNPSHVRVPGKTSQASRRRATLLVYGGAAALLLVAMGLRVGLAAADAGALVDLGLFRSRSFTWGTICTAFGVFALFGGMFALVQSFQAIFRVDPQGSGCRLLPLVAGLVVGTASIP